MKILDVKTAMRHVDMTAAQRELAAWCKHDGLREIINKDEEAVINALLAQVGNLDFCYEDEYHCVTTPIHAACKHDNLYILEKLLEMGASADIFVCNLQNRLEDDCTPLWELQYPFSISDDGNDAEREREAGIRLRMAKVLLEHGANPLAYTNEPENLYEYVEYKYYNEKDEDNYSYIKKFYELLQAFVR